MYEGRLLINSELKTIFRAEIPTVVCYPKIIRLKQFFHRAFTLASLQSYLTSYANLTRRMSLVLSLVSQNLVGIDLEASPSRKKRERVSINEHPHSQYSAIPRNLCVMSPVQFITPAFSRRVRFVLGCHFTGLEQMVSGLVQSDYDEQEVFFFFE